MKRTTLAVLCLLLVAFAATAAAQDSCQLINYRVKSGDTLSSIASKYLNNPKLWKELLKYNNIEDPNMIYTGDVIRIPSGDVLQKMADAKDDTEARKIATEAEKKRKTLNFNYRANGDSSGSSDSGRSAGVDIYATDSGATSGAEAGETLKVKALLQNLKSQPILELNRDPIGAR